MNFLLGYWQKTFVVFFMNMIYMKIQYFLLNFSLCFTFMVSYIWTNSCSWYRVFTTISTKYSGTRLKLLLLNEWRQGLEMDLLGCFPRFWWLLYLGLCLNCFLIFLLFTYHKKHNQFKQKIRDKGCTRRWRKGPKPMIFSLRGSNVDIWGCILCFQV